MSFSFKMTAERNALLEKVAQLETELAAIKAGQDVPDGYALVPVDPTPEMISASLKTAACMSQADPEDIERAIWHNMLAAAPSSKKESDDE